MLFVIYLLLAVPVELGGTVALDAIMDDHRVAPCTARAFAHGYVDDGGQQWTCDGHFWVTRSEADVRGVAH